ncbi:PTS sugar transporter subunit IIA [Enterococcus hirae]|nr:PTS sugar transporter subunit IIA [Enterococcus hirae]MDL4888101.1 PTS sugar transporter subunit IIA [Enterococcus hirae]MDL4890942.1 PTS sugar transporter subunit IIA [Enterococcus hirae]MDL4897138.1 PTS sugar transporter subunit IIA [Enterococcus hirae]MDL4899858.1 PTS sugar transporter subunit IIA [Enterococcus hirae]MDL4902297.1 PTS sugar transporter subunit IIA [Enterococcus hirae]
MERTIILASHGRFASGILDSLELIFGKTHSILALDCYGTETFDLAKSVQQLINDHQGQELIIITDLFGGSVNNEFLQYINRPNIYLIAGLNLPLLIEIATKIETADSIVELIHQVLNDSKEMIQFCMKVSKKNGRRRILGGIGNDYFNKSRSSFIAWSSRFFLDTINWGRLYFDRK